MTRNLGLGLAVCGVVFLASPPQLATAGDIPYRSFSSSPAIGPPAEVFATKLQAVSSLALGSTGEVHFTKLPGIPPIPPQFSGDIVSAVAAGQAGSGFDAAYISGSDLNRTWGFVFNSGVPFGPTFDEFMGFLYGRSIDNGQRSGLELVQELLAQRNVVAVPIVGSPEQLSGYFSEPMDDVRGHRGLGLVGLCQQHWVLRYLPPGENVLGLACDQLVAEGKVFRKNITFIAAVAGGGSLVQAVIDGLLHGFEFATAFDDVGTQFNTANNPGTVGLRFVHTPGWQQQFLVTWMLINKPVWNALTPVQRLLIQTVAQNHVLASYAENLRQQGPALKFILDANKYDGDLDNDMVLSQWSHRDQERLRDATVKFLNLRLNDTALPAADRADYARVLEALRLYVRENDMYWDHRQVKTSLRFDDWANPFGQCWEPQRCRFGH